MSESPLVLSSCGAAKRETACAAKDLYVGSYARMCLRAAYALADCPADVRILSAAHGLVYPDTVLEPYDIRLGDAEAITAPHLAVQAVDAGLYDRPVIVLAGAAYTRLVRQVWPHAQAPLLGVRGIGESRQRLAAILKTQAR
ncbi:DUF6884 domain-containing protein [Nocardia sp. NPDC048505]|uniref:DUF6884 domain-containing protein n=1 Tax=Nocardia sp. NPDC048505 TaxID=3155756 RepID=UPI0033C86A51